MCLLWSSEPTGPEMNFRTVTPTPEIPLSTTRWMQLKLTHVSSVALGLIWDAGFFGVKKAFPSEAHFAGVTAQRIGCKRQRKTDLERTKPQTRWKKSNIVISKDSVWWRFSSKRGFSWKSCRFYDGNIKPSLQMNNQAGKRKTWFILNKSKKIYGLFTILGIHFT